MSPVVTSVVSTIMLDGAQSVRAGPWTSEASCKDDNPTLNIRNLMMPELATAASGVPNLAGDLGPDVIATIFSGSVYEAGSFVFTREVQARAVLAAMDNIEFRYDTVGAHTWRRSAFEQGNVDTFLSRIGGDGSGEDADLPAGPVGSALEGSGSSLGS